MNVQPNELLRSHVTRVGFDLTLGRTHIAALVLLNESIKQRRNIPTRVQDLTFPTPVDTVRNLSRTFNLFVPGIHGCMSRRLVVHHFRETRSLSPKERARADAQGLKRHYTITKAGRLVIDLLKEAGIYQEYADALPRLEVVA